MFYTITHKYHGYLAYPVRFSLKHHNIACNSPASNPVFPESDPARSGLTVPDPPSDSGRLSLEEKARQLLVHVLQLDIEASKPGFTIRADSVAVVEDGAQAYHENRLHI